MKKKTIFTLGALVGALDGLLLMYYDGTIDTLSLVLAGGIGAIFGLILSIRMYAYLTGDDFLHKDLGWQPRERSADSLGRMYILGAVGVALVVLIVLSLGG